MKVKNRKYIGNLGKNILTYRRGRSLLTILAIGLSCILFTTLFSVLFGTIKSMENETMKTIGTRSHGSFKNVTKEDMEILSKDKDIVKSSHRGFIGILDREDIMAEVTYEEKAGLDLSFIHPIQGNYPQKKNEILVDRDTVKRLGYKPRLGQKIPLSYTIEDKMNSQKIGQRQDTFVISGLYNLPIESNVSVGGIYVSEKFYQSLKLPPRNNELSVDFSNTWNIRGKLEKVAERNGFEVSEGFSPYPEEREIGIGVNFAYLGNGDNFDFTQVFLPFIVLLFLIILTGYLLISNIFKISIVEDIQFYGLLKTLGATTRQIKKLVYLQGFFLSLPSVVGGGGLGLLLGNGILTRILSSTQSLGGVSISDRVFLIILPFATIFSLITVMVSCLKPARDAAKISPIEAVRFEEEVEIKKVLSKKFSLRKMAFREVLSNKFRFISVVLSISLAAIILSAVLTYTGNIDLEKGVSSIIRTDYNLAHPKYFQYMYLGDEILKEKYLQKIREEKGFVEGGGIYSQGGKIGYPDLKIRDLKVAPEVFGMDTYLVEKQKFLQGEFSRQDWESGKYSIIGEREESSSLKKGDRIRLSYEGKDLDLIIMGKIEYNFSNGLRYFSVIPEDGGQWEEGKKTLSQEYIYIPPQTYENFFGQKSLMSYGFDVEEKAKGSFESLLESMESNPDFTFDSRQRQVDSSRQFKNTIEFAGYSVSFVVFLIGILNYLNIIATDMLKNKRNLAILEAVGMTQNQILSYLTSKSSLYSILALVLSLVGGILLSEFVLKDLLSQMAWTGYKLSVLPLVIVNLVTIFIGYFFTRFFYQKKNSQSLIERIHSLRE